MNSNDKIRWIRSGETALGIELGSTRIKSVLIDKKPAFWISLLGVLAIAFVAVCLGTNPVEK